MADADGVGHRSVDHIDTLASKLENREAVNSSPDGSHQFESTRLPRDGALGDQDGPGNQEDVEKVSGVPEVATGAERFSSGSVVVRDQRRCDPGKCNLRGEGDNEGRSLPAPEMNDDDGLRRFGPTRQPLQYNIQVNFEGLTTVY